LAFACFFPTVAAAAACIFVDFFGWVTLCFSGHPKREGGKRESRQYHSEKFFKKKLKKDEKGKGMKRKGTNEKKKNSAWL
jgi:hypothetical protein